MSRIVLQGDHIDVMILAEGTYPYIRGGVSSWIHQLINGLPDVQFGICFVGARAEDYGEMQYQLPENLRHLEVHFLFGEGDPPMQRAQGKADAFKAVRQLHQWFRNKKGMLPEMIKNIGFYHDDIPYEHFLYSEEAWEYISEQYGANCPDVPFIDYFWTLRNIHRPIWKLAGIVKTLPESKVFHAPSTGYAGFLGALASYHTDRPLVLTEHGIYTRERKIDMLTAEWIDFHKPTLLKQPEEFNYIKKMWVTFFERIGEFAYERADPILSLYPGARNIQLRYGAKEERTAVIPNGVDVDGLKATMVNRPESVPHVITLIGRVVSIKDIKTFIRAMRITANAIPDVEGWIVGPMDEDKAYAEECFNMVKSMGLEEHVKFLGFQNIKDILPKTGVQTLTSISEGMPLVILEGFAAGVPCIATDVGSCRDLIYGGLDEADIALGAGGAVTTIANPTELAENYIRFLNDEALWKQAQKTALERVERYYRQELFLHAYRDIYQRLWE